MKPACGDPGLQRGILRLERSIRSTYFWHVEDFFVDHGGEPDVVIAGLGRMPRQSYLNRLNRGKPPKRRRL